MQVAVIADDNLSELFSYNASLQVKYHHSLQEIAMPPDVIFYLQDETTLPAVTPFLSGFGCPVIVNAVCTTLHDLPLHFIRINAWPGFLQRSIKEVVAREEERIFLQQLFSLLGWQFKLVADEPGMITARIIAMIINEAWFALEDGVSTEQNIDLAMKLGTNYPYGPFEWGSKIGLTKIVALLNSLAKEESRYTPAPLLLKNIS